MAQKSGLVYFQPLGLYLTHARANELFIAAETNLSLKITPKITPQEDGTVMLRAFMEAKATTTVMLDNEVLEDLNALAPSDAVEVDAAITRIKGGEPRMSGVVERFYIDGTVEGDEQEQQEPLFEYVDNLDMEAWLENLSNKDIAALAKHSELPAVSSGNRNIIEARLTGLIGGLSPDDMNTLLNKLDISTKGIIADLDNDDAGSDADAGNQDVAIADVEGATVFEYRVPTSHPQLTMMAHHFQYSPFSELLYGTKIGQKKDALKLAEAVQQFADATHRFAALESNSVEVSPVMQADGETVDPAATASRLASMRSENGTVLRTIQSESRETIGRIGDLINPIEIRLSLRNIDQMLSGIDHNLLPARIAAIYALVGAAFSRPDAGMSGNDPVPVKCEVTHGTDKDGNETTRYSIDQNGIMAAGAFLERSTNAAINQVLSGLVTNED